MKKKGFTLIELLAVIVILSVIAIITIPMILNVIEDSRKSAYKDSVLSAFNAIEYYVVDNNLGDVPASGIEVKNLNLKNNNFESGKIIKNVDGILTAEFISDGEYCATGTLTNLNISKGECEIDVPGIEVVVTSKTATITIVDTYGIIAYAITESSEEPTEWTEVEETTGITEDLEATHAGTYYVHVKNKYGKVNTKEYEVPTSAFNYDAVLEIKTYDATENSSSYNASCTTTPTGYGVCSNCHCNCPHGNGNGSAHCNYDISQGMSVTWIKSCPNGGTYNGSICVTGSSTSCSCPNGGTLSGNKCTITSYSCPDGGELSGTTCTKQEYTCPDGGTLNGTICER